MENKIFVYVPDLLLLHECNRAVTVSVDRQHLILHRDLLTEYAQSGGSASA